MIKAATNNWILICIYMYVFRYLYLHNSILGLFQYWKIMWGSSMPLVLTPPPLPLKKLPFEKLQYSETPNLIKIDQERIKGSNFN